METKKNKKLSKRRQLLIVVIIIIALLSILVEVTSSLKQEKEKKAYDGKMKTVLGNLEKVVFPLSPLEVDLCVTYKLTPNAVSQLQQYFKRNLMDSLLNITDIPSLNIFNKEHCKYFNGPELRNLLKWNDSLSYADKIIKDFTQFDILFVKENEDTNSDTLIYSTNLVEYRQLQSIQHLVFMDSTVYQYSNITYFDIRMTRNVFEGAASLLHSVLTFRLSHYIDKAQSTDEDIILFKNSTMTFGNNNRFCLPVQEEDISSLVKYSPYYVSNKFRFPISLGIVSVSDSIYKKIYLKGFEPPNKKSLLMLARVNGSEKMAIFKKDSTDE